MTAAISGRPARCLANRFTALGRDAPAASIPNYPIAYDAGKPDTALIGLTPVRSAAANTTSR